MACQNAVVELCDLFEEKAIAAFANGNYSLARDFLEAALAEMDLFEEDEGMFLSKLNNLAVVYSVQDRLEAAEKLYRRALGIFVNLDDHERTEFPVVLENYAFLLRKQEQHDLAQGYEACAEALRVIGCAALDKEMDTTDERPQLRVA